MDIKLTREEQFEIFGETFVNEDYAAEAERRWGDTEEWRQSQARTAQYTKEQWVAIKAEGDDLNRRFTAAMRAGEPADGVSAMDLAEEARGQISRWFYDCSVAIHRGLGRMCTADARFTATYEAVHPGLAAYVSRAIEANADRQEAASA